MPIKFEVNILTAGYGVSSMERIIHERWMAAAVQAIIDKFKDADRDGILPTLAYSDDFIGALNRASRNDVLVSSDPPIIAIVTDMVCAVSDKDRTRTVRALLGCIMQSQARILCVLPDGPDGAAQIRDSVLDGSNDEDVVTKPGYYQDYSWFTAIVESLGVSNRVKVVKVSEL